MSFDAETEVIVLKQRVTILEEALNKAIEALNNAVSRKAFQEMLLLRQKEMSLALERIDALENQVSLLESEVHE